MLLQARRSRFRSANSWIRRHNWVAETFLGGRAAPQWVVDKVGEVVADNNVRSWSHCRVSFWSEWVREPHCDGEEVLMIPGGIVGLILIIILIIIIF